MQGWIPDAQVRVIIVNYNGGEYLQRCVEAMAAQAGVIWECVIVDNGSSDGSLDGLALDDRFRVIEAGKNLGFAAGNNRGAKGASARWIACLNPDAFARPGWLARLVSGAESAGVQMAGSTQVFANEPDRLDGLGDGYSIWGLAWRAGFGHPISEIPDAPYAVFGPCAAAALYDRELFERLGGFDESFFCYHEDVDLAFRMRRAGAQCLQFPDAIVDHVSSGITGRASDFAVFHGTRNRVRTYLKNMPTAGLWLFLIPFAWMNVAILVWSLFRPGRAKPTWRGFFANRNYDWLAARRDVPKDVGLRGLWPYLAVNPTAVIKRRVAPRVKSD